MSVRSFFCRQRRQEVVACLAFLPYQPQGVAKLWHLRSCVVQGNGRLGIQRMSTMPLSETPTSRKQTADDVMQFVNVQVIQPRPLACQLPSRVLRAFDRTERRHCWCLEVLDATSLRYGYELRRNATTAVNHTLSNRAAHDRAPHRAP